MVVSDTFVCQESYDRELADFGIQTIELQQPGPSGSRGQTPKPLPLEDGPAPDTGVVDSELTKQLSRVRMAHTKVFALRSKNA